MPSAKRKRARAPSTKSQRVAATAGGKLALCEVGERVVLSFLPLVPDRLAAERVCSRWRRLSRLETAIQALEFGGVVHARLLTKQRVAQLVQRANGQLRSLALPNVQLDDAIVQSVCANVELQTLRAHRILKKHVFQILAACRGLKRLELLDCQGIQLAGWGRGFQHVRLQEVVLNDCNLLTNAAASSLVEMCGDELKVLVLMGATSLDSQIFPLIARTSTLTELTITHSRDIQELDLRFIVEAQVGLRWLDFSFCGGLSLFPTVMHPLPKLEVLLLDRTKISDSGLRAIAEIAPELKYLSLQDCWSISDAGIIAIASPGRCAKLELLDLKGTSATDKSVLAFERTCARLRMVRLDSCRSISRAMRVKYSERARKIALSGRLTELERTFLYRKKAEFIDDDDDDDAQSNADASASDSDF